MSPSAEKSSGSLTEIIAATDLDEKPVIEGSTISTEI